MSASLLSHTKTKHENGLRPAAYGGLVPSRLADARHNFFLLEAHAAFRNQIVRNEFPCLGGRAALNSQSYCLAVYHQLAGRETTDLLGRDLYEFTRSDLRLESEYATFVAVFRKPAAANERQFEKRMWQQLAALNRIDAVNHEWDTNVRSDTADPQFSFSFGGQALYVIGMHPNSSRMARRFRWPVLIFNPHEQFERLRADGKWKRMQQAIRERDLRLQGSINPMLSDFGESSEARQYSGRAVEEGWRPPFAALKGKCPFAH